MPDLLLRLKQPGILVTDGATGTMLQSAGLPAGSPSEAWDLDNHDGVRWLHTQYVNAGSDCVLTNTFGGTRIKLEGSSLGSQAAQINRSAALLASQVAAGRVFVFGDLGPTGKLMDPLGPLTFAEAEQAFYEQACALAEGGVDAFVIETMSDLSEAKAALEGVRRASSLPVAVTMSFDTHGRTMMGVKPAAARQLLSAGADIIGANCGRTLSETLSAIQEMRQAAPEAVLWAKPNAGLPHMDGSQTVYDVSPEVMAEYALKFAAEGVRFFGGCCGSTPAHIQAIAVALKSAG